LIGLDNDALPIRDHCLSRYIIIAVFRGLLVRHLRLHQEQAVQVVGAVLEFKLHMVVGDAQVLAGSYVSNPDDLLEHDVATLERVDSLDLPARVGEEQALLLLLDVDALLISALQLFHVLIVDQGVLELLVAHNLLFFRVCQLRPIDSSLWPLDFLPDVHSPNL